MYPEEIVLPMREELTSVGFKQVTTSSEIESAIKSSGTITFSSNNTYTGDYTKSAGKLTISGTLSDKTDINSRSNF